MLDPWSLNLIVAHWEYLSRCKVYPIYTSKTFLVIWILQKNQFFSSLFLIFIQLIYSLTPRSNYFVILFHCQPYSSYNVSSDNLVLYQLIIPKLIFFSILITYLVDIVLILYWYCIDIVLILYWYCIDIVLILYWYCIDIVLILYWYCIDIVLILYWYCIDIVWRKGLNQVQLNMFCWCGWDISYTLR